MQNPLFPVSRASLWLIAATTVFWALYAQVSNYNLDLYRDMLENHGLGIRWRWGGDKHPPLFGWMTAAWFAIFPRVDFSYRIFAALNIGITLFAMILVARRYFAPAMQQALVLAALVAPLLGFQALTYNANAAMLPFWAGTILFYMRVWEDRRLIDAAVLGLLAALGLLAKYYFAVLLIALVAHAVSAKETRAILFSSRGLMVVAIFASVIAPHVMWLMAHDFAPFRFAADGQGDESVATVLASQGEFLVAQIAYVIPSIAILGLLRSPNDGSPLFAIGQFKKIFSDAKGRLIIWSGPVALGITMLLGLVVWSPLTSNWSMPVMVSLAILVVGLLPSQVAQRNSWRVKWIAVIFFVVLVAAGPFIKQLQLASARANAAVPIQLLSLGAAHLWKTRANAPLAYVTGDSTLAYGISFYVPERPHVLDNRRQLNAPWVDPKTLQTAGYMIVCRTLDCSAARSVKGWQNTLLGEVDSAAPDGAGGPKRYKAYIWRAMPDNAE